MTKQDHFQAVCHALYYGNEFSDALLTLFVDCPHSGDSKADKEAWFQKNKFAIADFVTKITTTYQLPAQDWAWIALVFGCKDHSFHAYGERVLLGQYMGLDVREALQREGLEMPH